MCTKLTGDAGNRCEAKMGNKLGSMPIFVFTILVSVSCLFSTYAAQAQDQEHVSRGYSYFLNHPNELPNHNALQTLQGFHVVFVGGYMGRLINMQAEDEQQYFAYNQKALADMGITSSVHIPRSLEMIEESADSLSRVLEQHKKIGGGKPLLLIGHSRGGPVAVSTILRHPELLQNGVVAKVVTLQSPVLRNLWAEMGGRELISRLWPLRYGYYGLKAIESEYIERALGEGYRRLSSAQQQLVNRAVLWHISSADPASDREKRLADDFIKQNILNDTLVASATMWRSDYGRVMGHATPISHMASSFVRTDDVERSRAKIRALMSAMVEDLAFNLTSDDEVVLAKQSYILQSLNLEPMQFVKPAPSWPMSYFHDCAMVLKGLYSITP